MMNTTSRYTKPTVNLKQYHYTGMPNVPPKNSSLKSEKCLATSRNICPSLNAFLPRPHLGAVLWSRNQARVGSVGCSAVKSGFGGAIISPVKEEGASDVDEGSSDAECL